MHMRHSIPSMRKYVCESKPGRLSGRSSREHGQSRRWESKQAAFMPKTVTIDDDELIQYFDHRRETLVTPGGITLESYFRGLSF